MIGLKKQQENKTDCSDIVDLEEGEMICDKCEGRGSHPAEIDVDTCQSVCQKCQGDGKVDWISNVVGKPKKTYGNLSSSCITYTALPPRPKTGSMWTDTHKTYKIYDGYRWVDV